jgi:hypothetical protein
VRRPRPAPANYIRPADESEQAPSGRPRPLRAGYLWQGDWGAAALGLVELDTRSGGIGVLTPQELSKNKESRRVR